MWRRWGRCREVGSQRRSWSTRCWAGACSGGSWRRHTARPGSPFVGRSRELVTLLTLLTQVEDGQGHVVGIMGAPGIGKSRLLDEFHQRLRGRRLTYLRGRCLSYGSATLYLPVLDLL